MNNLSAEYKLSLYTSISELSKEKIFIVKSSVDDRIYVKKILKLENFKIYSNLKNINSPNLPTIHEIIKLDEKLFIIEEFVNGSTLAKVLEEFETISESMVIEYALELAEVLSLIHSSRPPIIHRDIKPSNIIISNDGILKLIDFDVSRTQKEDKSTDTDFLGTYGYAAPEQFGFGQSDCRTDIYSLGVTMNILLTGKFPVIKLYSGQLGSIISKCTRLDPTHRFQSIYEFKKALLKKSNGINRIKVKSTGISTPNIKNFNLPGFRGASRPLKLMAFLWYLFLALAGFGFFTEIHSYENRLSDVVISLFMFSLTLLYGNYIDVKSRLPILKSKNIFLKLIGYILYTLTISLVFGIFIPA